MDSFPGSTRQAAAPLYPKSITTLIHKAMVNDDKLRVFESPVHLFALQYWPRIKSTPCLYGHQCPILEGAFALSGDHMDESLDITSLAAIRHSHTLRAIRFLPSCPKRIERSERIGQPPNRPFLIAILEQPVRRQESLDRPFSNHTLKEGGRRARSTIKDVSRHPYLNGVCCVSARTTNADTISRAEPTHGCCWEAFYILAYCGLVGNPHLTAKI